MTASNLKFVLACLLAAAFVGCKTSSSTKPSLPPVRPQAEYTEVEFKRFVSGVYVDDLTDKFVRLHCRYISTIAGRVPAGYKADKWMALTVGYPPGGEMVPAHVTVVAPKDMDDAIFAYKHGDGIEVRGQARLVVRGARYKTLIIQADAIEKRQ